MQLLNVGKRILAYIIDFILLSVVTNVLIYIIAMLNIFTLGIFLEYSIFIVIFALYFIFMESSRQATVGKMLLKITVSKMSVLTSTQKVVLFFIPELLYLVDVTSFYAIPQISVIYLVLKLIWLAPILFRKDQKGLYEILTGTSTSCR